MDEPKTERRVSTCSNMSQWSNLASLQDAAAFPSMDVAEPNASDDAFASPALSQPWAKAAKKRSSFRIPGRRDSTKLEQIEEQKPDDQTHGHKPVLMDVEAMKEKVREKLSKPQYKVTDYYYTTGCSQAVARSPLFDKMTLVVIAFNALWIAIDTDMNQSDLLLDADPVFFIAENLFCLFFTFEWTVRFFSFRRKCNGLKDAWFVFDTLLVWMMILETWIFTGIVLAANGGGSSGGAGGGDVSILRIGRLLRLSRMARMGKLLRVMPELLIMIKGMKAATRSVFWTLFLMVVIMYVFGIAFVQLAEGTEIGERHFHTVPGSMYTLLIYGIFLDNVGTFVDKLENQWLLASVFFAFVLLGALTVMNMLIGVLCEVVSAVAETEREEMLVNYVNEKMSRVMTALDSDGSGSISKKEFSMLLHNQEAVRCMSDVGVDVNAIIDLADYIFQNDSSEDIELDFTRFMEVVLQLRGTNKATVKDIVDLRQFMRTLMQEQGKQTASILQKFTTGMEKHDEKIDMIAERSTIFSMSSQEMLRRTMMSVKESTNSPAVASPVTSRPDNDGDDLLKENSIKVDMLDQEEACYWSEGWKAMGSGFGAQEASPKGLELKADFLEAEWDALPKLAVIPLPAQTRNDGISHRGIDALTEDLTLMGPWSPVNGVGTSGKKQDPPKINERILKRLNADDVEVSMSAPPHAHNGDGLDININVRSPALGVTSPRLPSKESSSLRSDPINKFSSSKDPKFLAQL